MREAAVLFIHQSMCVEAANHYQLPVVLSSGYDSSVCPPHNDPDEPDRERCCENCEFLSSARRRGSGGSTGRPPRAGTDPPVPKSGKRAGGSKSLLACGQGNLICSVCVDLQHCISVRLSQLHELCQHKRMRMRSLQARIGYQ